MLEFEIGSTDGEARAGVITTARGSFRTPAFMPVGTRAGIRAVSTADLEAAGAEVMLCNTYHLMMRPGADVVEACGGIHGFSSWPAHVLTDSGGFQIFSLQAKYDEEGTTFRSVYDGSVHRFTPEDAVVVQRKLGSDIQMVLDVCPPLPSPREVLRNTVDLTLRWAERALVQHRSLTGSQAIFGIVQGGDDEELRATSAKATAGLGFDGYGVGGLSVGESPEVRRQALASALEYLPRDRPRYLMGLGDPVGIVEAVSMGVDMFDCVLPTRLARHGTALTSAGKMNLKRAEFQRDCRPIEEGCLCPCCGRYTRAYLRHLLLVGDPTAMRLTSIHNLTWILALLARIRRAVESKTLAALLSTTIESYGAGSPAK